MLLETLQTLVQAGADALQTSCGLTVTRPHVSLVRQGSLTFPSLGELHVRNGTVQRVHLGCDTALVGQLAELAGGSTSLSGLQVLAEQLLRHLLEGMEGRNPRGTVENLAVAPLTLQTRGLRTFGFRLETEAGQLFLLAEAPSRVELEIAKNSEFLEGMIATYLPREWRSHESYTSRTVVDSVLVFLRKLEQDIFLEVPRGQDLVTHPGFLVLAGSFDGRRALKLCADVHDSDLGSPGRGDVVRAFAGVGDRSLEFDLEYLGSGSHDVAGAELPCLWFAAPEEVRVTQRRRTFRLNVPEPVAVEIESSACALGRSPWADDEPARSVSHGRLQDLSFSGARIVLTSHDEAVDLSPGRRVQCRLHLPGDDEPVSVVGLVRRSSMGLADRNSWQAEVGVEFIAADDDDRGGLQAIRDYVLTLQRERLAHRVLVPGGRRR
jgi:c-di-GMP-binding flagellar brake protein YcgR